MGDVRFSNLAVSNGLKWRLYNDVNTTRAVIGCFPWSIRVHIHGWRHEKLIFCAFVQHGARFWICLWDNILGLSKWKPCKKVRRSYWHRKKNGETETKTVLDDLRIPKEIFTSSKRETRWFAKCFRHYSALRKWRCWKTFRRNCIKVR